MASSRIGDAIRLTSRILHLVEHFNMVAIRVRHPKGIVTLQLDLDVLTVQDLLQQIFTFSEIPPSQQESELVAISHLPHVRSTFLTQSDRGTLRKC